jgi:hypothetical protein
MSRRKGQKKSEPARKVPREFNPVAPTNLARTIAIALEEQPALALPLVERFEGAGVYALYYVGRFEPYSPIAGMEKPIYVGKAVPKGGRKGAVGLDVDAPPGRVLFGRLNKHAGSIEAAANIELSDFRCRALVVDPFYAVVAESLLIRRLSPIWNRVVTGFGINAPGGRREKQYRSLWDTLHPGRTYAAKLTRNPMDASAIRDLLRRFFKGQVEPIEIETAEEEDETE